MWPQQGYMPRFLTKMVLTECRLMLMMLPSHATMMVERLLFSGIKHLCPGDIFKPIISFISALTSETSGTSQVRRSKSFSWSEVISHALERRIFSDVFKGPRKMPLRSKLCGVI